jgi:hypothetical protein
MSPARVTAQRDRLLAALEKLARLGRLGEQPGAAYVEIHRSHIRQAEKVCERTRAAIAKATGSSND